MTLSTWITLAVTLVGWLGTIIAFMRKSEIDRLNIQAEFNKEISLIKEKVERYEKDFHQHELGNEKQFERYHNEVKEDIEKLFGAINALKDQMMQLAIKGAFKTD